MDKTTEIAAYVLDVIDDILDELREGEDVSELHAKYNQLVNRGKRKLWKKYIRPNIESAKDEKWLDDAGDAVDIVRMVLRRWG